MTSQASIPSSLSRGVNAIQSFFTSSVQSPQRFPLVAAASASLVYVTYKVWIDYQTWLALGPGGVPYNFGGYITQVFTHVFKAHRDLLSTDMYDDPAILAKYGSDDETFGSKRYLSDVDLPHRKPPRPLVFNYATPQRQERPGLLIYETQLQREAIDRIVEENAGLLESKTSFLEKRGSGVFLAENVAAPAYGTVANREVGHVHFEAEGSSHWILSPADAKVVMERGWGHRHPLSGCSPIIPHSYLLLYAPRTVEEVEVHNNIVKAAVAFASGGKDVR